MLSPHRSRILANNGEYIIRSRASHIPGKCHQANLASHTDILRKSQPDFECAF